MDTRIVRRYTAALFASAQAENALDLVESDLGLITYSFESIPSLEEAIVSPIIPSAKKREIISSIFKEKVHETTLFYLYLLIDNRREGVIRATEAEYIRLANEARGMIAGHVTSAVELTEGEMTRLRAKLSAHTGRRVNISVDVDPSIIGGLIVRIGDTIMDGSIAGHLERLRDEFLGRQ